MFKQHYNKVPNGLYKSGKIRLIICTIIRLHGGRNLQGTKTDLTGTRADNRMTIGFFWLKIGINRGLFRKQWKHSRSFGLGGEREIISWVYVERLTCQKGLWPTETVDDWPWETIWDTTWQNTYMDLRVGVHAFASKQICMHLFALLYWTVITKPTCTIYK